MLTEADKEARRWVLKDLPTLHVAASLCGQLRTAVQAGGLHGVFAGALAKRFETVHVFEPDPRLFGIMAYNIGGTPNVRMYGAALGAHHTPVSTKAGRRDGNEARSQHAGTTHVVSGGTIATLKIDDLNLIHCDLIQLDVEGYELEALQGATHTIEVSRPVIMVEVNSNLTAMGYRESDIDYWIRSRGYRQHSAIRSDRIYVHG